MTAVCTRLRSRREAGCAPGTARAGGWPHRSTRRKCGIGRSWLLALRPARGVSACGYVVECGRRVMYLLRVEIFYLVPRHVLGQGEHAHPAGDGGSHHALEGVLGMVTELSRVTVVGEWHRWYSGLAVWAGCLGAGSMLTHTTVRFVGGFAGEERTDKRGPSTESYTQPSGNVRSLIR